MAEEETVTARLELDTKGLRQGLNGAEELIDNAEKKRKKKKHDALAEQLKSEKDLLRDMRRLFKQQAEAFSRMEKQKLDAIKATSREAEQVARREARRKERQAKRIGGGFGDLFGSMGLPMMGGFAMAGTAAATMATSYFKYQGQNAAIAKSVSGLKGREEARVDAANLEVSRIRLANEVSAGTGEGFESVMEKIRGAELTGARYGISQEETLQHLQTQQTRFSDFGIAVESLASMAKVAAATGDSLEDLGGVTALAKKQLGLQNDEVDEFLGYLRSAGLQGAVTPGEFAQHFGPIMGQFAALTGQKGMGAIKEMVSLGQISKRMGSETSTAANNYANVIGSLSREDIQKRFKKKGIQLFDKEGTFMGLPALREAMIAKGITDMPSLTQVMPDAQSKNFLLSLLQQGGDLGALMNLSGQAGYEELMQSFGRVAETESFGGKQRAALADIQLGQQGTGVGIKQLVTDEAALRNAVDAFGDIDGGNSWLAKAEAMIAQSVGDTFGAGAGLSFLKFLSSGQEREGIVDKAIAQTEAQAEMADTVLDEKSVKALGQEFRNAVAPLVENRLPAGRTSSFGRGD